MSIPDQQSIVLEFSFVGMKTKTVTYTGQKEINVVLEEDVSEMEEVVVTGYQKIERRKLTSSNYHGGYGPFAYGESAEY